MSNIRNKIVSATTAGLLAVLPSCRSTSVRTEPHYLILSAADAAIGKPGGKRPHQVHELLPYGLLLDTPFPLSGSAIYKILNALD